MPLATAHQAETATTTAVNGLSRNFQTLIFKVLYSFSNSSLHELFLKSRAFRCLLRISLIKKKEIFNINGWKAPHQSDAVGKSLGEESEPEDISYSESSYEHTGGTKRKGRRPMAKQVKKPAAKPN